MGVEIQLPTILTIIVTAAVDSINPCAIGGLIYFFTKIPLVVTEYLSIAVALLVVLAGILEIKDFFWYGRGFSLAIPPSMAKKIEGFASHTTVVGVALLGGFVSAVELPCAGAAH